MAQQVRRMRNPLALAVLACLWERPMHPYEISGTLRERSKEHSIKINYGSLYSVVDSLARREWIEPVATSRDGNRPARTTYAITDAGSHELRDWMRELLSTPQKEYPAIEAALSLLPVLPPDAAAELLGKRVAALSAELAGIHEADRQLDELAFPRLFRIEGDLHAALVRAERDYLSRLTEEIRSGSLPGIAVWRKIHDLIAAGHSVAEIATNASRYFDEEVARWLSAEQHQ